MRILQINKFFYVRGGSGVVFLETIRGLRAAHHSVAEFAMQDERNVPSGYSKYFAPAIPDLREQKNWSEKWQVFKNLFYSREVEKRLTALVKEFKPDVVHVHDAYRELSASTFLTLKKLGVPVVLTVHDFFPLCPNHSLLKGETLAEKELAGKPLACVVNKCVNNEFFPSLAGALEASYYRYAKIWDNIDLYICPSEFVKNKMVEYGFDEKKMRVNMNPCEVAESCPVLGNKILYASRLHVEKGIKFFMEAMKNLPEYEAVIAGDGPEKVWVENFIQKNDLKNVEMRGWLNGEEMEKVLAEAKVCVIPSVFYDTCSLSIMEAQARKRLVVATRRGGNTELVLDGETGFLAEPENVKSLEKAIRKAMEVPAKEAAAIGERARKMVLDHHDLKGYVASLEGIYKEAIAK